MSGFTRTYRLQGAFLARAHGHRENYGAKNLVRSRVQLTERTATGAIVTISSTVASVEIPFRVRNARRFTDLRRDEQQLLAQKTDGGGA